MRALALLLFVGTAAADDRPRFTINCDHDGWTCFDNFPAISKDHLTIAHAVTYGEAIVVEFVSVASSRVLRREKAFEASIDFPTPVRVAKLHRELRDFRAMTMSEDDQNTYARGTITLTISYCEADCRTSYRVTRRRR